MKTLYNPKRGERINITQEQLDEIRSAESCVTESSYYSHMVVWDTELSEEMQMLAITAKPKQWVVDKYAENIDVHMALLSTIYIDEGDEGTNMGYKRPFGNSDVIGDVIDELVQLGRMKQNDDDDDDDDERREEGLAQKILEEFSCFIQDFFADGFEPTTTGFIGVGNNNYINYHSEEMIDKWKAIGVNPNHTYLYAWEPDKSALRELKLKEIGI
jgi:hypothetical protein